jgi:hypothetical protein
MQSAPHVRKDALQVHYSEAATDFQLAETSSHSRGTLGSWAEVLRVTCICKSIACVSYPGIKSRDLTRHLSCTRDARMQK